MKTFEGFRGGTTQICSENEDVMGGGGGGNPAVNKHSKGGAAKFHLV